MMRDCVRCGGVTERYANGRCKPCAREAQRRYAEQNPEKMRGAQRRWAERNPENARERNRRYREQNPEKARESRRRWREQNPEKVREGKRRYYERNPEKARESKRRRRALEHAALIHDVTDQEVWEYNPNGPGCCNYCHKQLTLDRRDEWHIDHVVPLSRGGTHELANLVIACATCNLSKGAKLLTEWQPRLERAV